MYTHWNIYNRFCFQLHLASWLYKLQGQTHLSSGNYQKCMGIYTVNKNICFISTKLDKMKSSTVHIIEKLHFIKIFNVLPYWSPNCLLFKYWILTDVDMVYLDIHNIQTYNQGYILSHIKWGYVCLYSHPHNFLVRLSIIFKTVNPPFKNWLKVINFSSLRIRET